MNINPVILISSCQADRKNGYHQAIRDTWGKTSVIPYRFFLGDIPPEALDEVELECPDNYYSLPLKTQESLRWGMCYGYTHFFRAFTDTYIDTVRLKQALNGYHTHDYVGNPCGFYDDLFMHGGPGYWLSEKGAQAVVNTSAAGEQLEDFWVGRVVREYRLHSSHDFRYSMGDSYNRRELPIRPDNDIITQHLGTQGSKYHPSLMQAAHRRRFPL